MGVKVVLRKMRKERKEEAYFFQEHEAWIGPFPTESDHRQDWKIVPQAIDH